MHSSGGKKAKKKKKKVNESLLQHTLDGPRVRISANRGCQNCSAPVPRQSPYRGQPPTEGCLLYTEYPILRTAPLPASMLVSDFKRSTCSSLKKAYAMHRSLCNFHDTPQIVTSQTVKTILQREDAFRKNCRYTHLRWLEAEGDSVQRWREQTMRNHDFRCMFAYPIISHSNFRHKLRNSPLCIGQGDKRGELPPPEYDIDISLVLWSARPLFAGLR